MDRLTRKSALLILVLMGILMYSSAFNDAAVVDEDPHIGAGISYLTQQDMRLNPEHPPLVKDLSALPLLLIPGLVVPVGDASWAEDINGQWDFGRAFLFQSGNDADLILHLARIAPILITLLLGWFLFRWTYEHRGRVAAFFALFFYISCPVALAHGRLVTTDVPAAAGVFIGTYFFLRYLFMPSWRTLLYAGIAFGLAQLMKFSVVLLIPFFTLLAISWWILTLFEKGSERRTSESVPEASRHGLRLQSERDAEGQAAVFSPGKPTAPFQSASQAALTYLGGSLLIGLIGLGIISIVYAFHVWHYPPERQLNDIKYILRSFPNQTFAKIVIAMTGIDLLRPLAQYLFGFLMVAQRTIGGNTTFFLGEVSASGWTSYFPIVYLIKLPLAFHILTVLSTMLGISAAVRAMRTCLRHVHSQKERARETAQWFRTHFTELSMLLFIAIYWTTSLTSNLNIGVRHLMPTIPFVIFLTALGTRKYLEPHVPELARSFAQNTRALLGSTFSLSFRLIAVGLLCLWMLISSFIAWPSYLSSFNELVFLHGGFSTALAQDGANWAVDSNLDWGQDLKRLARYVEHRHIQRIAVDYFGWTPPTYYIKTAEVMPWDAGKGQPHGWFAVSATYKQQACAKPAPGFTNDTTGYCFLNKYVPLDVIGGSIYVYHLP